MGAKEKRTGLDNIRLVPASATISHDETAPESRIEGQPSNEKPKGKGKPGIKQHTAYLPEAVHEQLRTLAFQEKKKIHDYLLEGLDCVFKNRGLKSIKELS